MTRLKLPKPMTGAALKKWRERQPSGFPGEACLTPAEAEAVFRFDKADGKGRSWRRWEDGTHPVPAWLQGLVGSPDAPWAKLSDEQVGKAADSVAVATVTKEAARLLKRLNSAGGQRLALWAGDTDDLGYRPWWVRNLLTNRAENLDGRTMRVLEERGLVAPARKHDRKESARPYDLTDRGRLVASA